MQGLREVVVPAMSPQRLEPVLGVDRFYRLLATAEDVRAVLDQRAVLHVSSTASGGGVAEMLYTLLSYVRGLSVDTRWFVLDGDPEFFAVTKRIHNRVYGAAGDTGALGAAERVRYENDRSYAERPGKAARARAQERFLGDVHLAQWGHMLADVLPGKKPKVSKGEGECVIMSICGSCGQPVSRTGPAWAVGEDLYCSIECARSGQARSAWRPGRGDGDLDPIGTTSPRIGAAIRSVNPIPVHSSPPRPLGGGHPRLSGLRRCLSKARGIHPARS